MREIEIMLSSIENVKHFVQTITMFDGEFELVSGKYIVDAKYIENLRCEDFHASCSLLKLKNDTIPLLFPTA